MTGLVVIHVDGLSHRRLLEAVDKGHMPFVARLLQTDGYEALAYRCGVPSTTPFAQAGILFGDNSEIPSYRWWDKQADLLVSFGAGSTFGRVEKSYFAGRTPLTQGGACIAALYRAGEADRFGPVYEERHRPDEPDAGGRAIAAFLVNPVTLFFWIRHGGLALFRIAGEYMRARFEGRRTANVYVVADIYHEVIVHHLTRFALLQAMDQGLLCIYACFYTYDEAAHAFGPEDPNTLRVLRHIDNTIRFAAEHSRRNKAAMGYDLAILSDHGQVETTPFRAGGAPPFGQTLAGWLPGHRVTEHRGGVFGPAPSERAARVEIAYSGGLAHVYFADLPGRLDRAELEAAHPGLAERVTGVRGVGLVMQKDGEHGSLLTQARRCSLASPLPAETAELLAAFDEPEVLAGQLRRLNSFERAGDLVIFGAYDGSKQVNFEDQVGGHGSIGGDQLHPFVLAKREWGFDTTGITNAAELHPLLVRIRDRH